MRGERPAAGQELVEERAQRVDVGRRRHRAPRHLLGARVLGRRERRQGARLRQAGGARIRIEDLGDPEVEEPHLPSGEQDVRRLEIAVDDQVRVREGDRPADLLEELEPAFERQALRVARFGDRPPVDVLEDEVGDPLRVDPRVEQAGDRAVGEARERLSLDPEAREELLALEPAPDPLDRHPPPVARLVPLGEPDLPHSAPADPFDQLVGAEAPAGRVRPVRVVAHARLDREAPFAVVRRQELAEFPSLVGRQLAEPEIALGRRRLRELREELFQSQPALPFHRDESFPRRA